ncbi:hypothetical protein C8Q70DRAFT_685800 [Cubamyces menziesii]|nr:hypothetical protein C8Q70DRAFT_685800 [Cubamyces menziesii]
MTPLVAMLLDVHLQVDGVNRLAKILDDRSARARSFLDYEENIRLLLTALTHGSQSDPELDTPARWQATTLLAASRRAWDKQPLRTALSLYGALYAEENIAMLRDLELLDEDDPKAMLHLLRAVAEKSPSLAYWIFAAYSNEPVTHVYRTYLRERRSLAQVIALADAGVDEMHCDYGFYFDSNIDTVRLDMRGENIILNARCAQVYKGAGYASDDSFECIATVDGSRVYYPRDVSRKAPLTSTKRYWLVVLGKWSESGVPVNARKDTKTCARMTVASRNSDVTYSEPLEAVLMVQDSRIRGSTRWQAESTIVLEDFHRRVASWRYREVPLGVRFAS